MRNSNQRRLNDRIALPARCLALAHFQALPLARLNGRRRTHSRSTAVGAALAGAAITTGFGFIFLTRPTMAAVNAVGGARPAPRSRAP
jgi:hypothetical protein